MIVDLREVGDMRDLYRKVWTIRDTADQLGRCCVSLEIPTGIPGYESFVDAGLVVCGSQVSAFPVAKWFADQGHDHRSIKWHPLSRLQVIMQFGLFHTSHVAAMLAGPCELSLLQKLSNVGEL